MTHSRTKKIIGWILSCLVGLFLLGVSGVPKFFDFPGKGEMMEHLGIPLSLLPTIAVVEITVTVIYLVPRTSFLGAILTTAYLGGAVFTHVRAGDGLFEILFPAFVGVTMWIGLSLRQPILFSLALGCWTDNGTDGAKP